jgi:hypothetical protein
MKPEIPAGRPFRIAIVALIGAAVGFLVGGMKASFLPLLGVMVAVFGDILVQGLIPLSRLMGFRRTLLLAVVPALLFAAGRADNYFQQGGAAYRDAYESGPRQLMTLGMMATGGIICLVLGRWISRESGYLSVRDGTVLFFIIQVWITLLLGMVYFALTQRIEPM